LLPTMTSWLLFAGDFVYKVRKPARFQFLDAETPAKRYKLCCDEVRLNRRLAPQVYVGVVGIAEKRGNYALVANLARRGEKIHEFAVLMHKLPGNRMLNRMLTKRTVHRADIQELTNKLSAFHMNASFARSKVWGSAQAVSHLTISNLSEAWELAADSVSRGSLAAVKEYSRRFLVSRRQTLDNRVRDGYVREGHGDLRCESVCFAPEGLAIIDCIEQSEGLRYGDVASELAALAVDLESVGRSDLADELVNAYIAETNDPGLAELLRFYKCYRAVLRGKLAALTSLQPELPMEQRMLERANAGRFFTLAQSYLLASDATTSS
jgi:uncharacterized protein